MSWILAIYLVIAFFVNLPFGYWRTGHPRMSLKWLFHIHAPIPGLILLRFALALPFTLPIVVASIVTCILSQRIAGSFNEEEPKLTGEI